MEGVSLLYYINACMNYIKFLKSEKKKKRQNDSNRYSTITESIKQGKLSYSNKKGGIPSIKSILKKPQ